MCIRNEHSNRVIKGKKAKNMIKPEKNVLLLYGHQDDLVYDKYFWRQNLPGSIKH